MRPEKERTPEESLRRLIAESGAAAYAVTPATTVEERLDISYGRWIADGRHGGMHYLENHMALRHDPRLLLEGAASIICLAFPYAPPEASEVDARWALYALGDDYHDVLRRRLGTLCEEMRNEWGGDYRICIDSAPIHERYWAVRSRLATPTLNGNVSVSGIGTMAFLAEIITTLELPQEHPAEPAQGCSGCGLCRRSCPTGAISEGSELTGIDASRCINYLTIEHRGEWTSAQRSLLGAENGEPRALFGCDICQRVCPLNARERSVLPEFHPRDIFLSGKLTSRRILEMTQTEFSTIFRGSPVKRAKLAGLRRNAGAKPEKES